MRHTCSYGGDRFSTPWGRFVPDGYQLAQRVPDIMTDKSSYIYAAKMAKQSLRPTDPSALPNDAPTPSKLSQVVPYTSLHVPGAETLDVHRPLARVTAVPHPGRSLALDAAQAFLEPLRGVEAALAPLLGSGLVRLQALGAGLHLGLCDNRRPP